MTFIAVYRVRPPVKMVTRLIRVCQKRRNAMDISTVEPVVMKKDVQAPNVDWINSDVSMDKSASTTYANVTTKLIAMTEAMNRVAVSILTHLIGIFITLQIIIFSANKNRADDFI